MSSFDEDEKNEEDEEDWLNVELNDEELDNSFENQSLLSVDLSEDITLPSYEDLVIESEETNKPAEENISVEYGFLFTDRFALYDRTSNKKPIISHRVSFVGSEFSEQDNHNMLDAIQSQSLVFGMIKAYFSYDNRFNYITSSESPNKSNDNKHNRLGFLSLVGCDEIKSKEISMFDILNKPIDYNVSKELELSKDDTHKSYVNVLKEKVLCKQL